ncbi:hypothetical protein [Actinoplanes lobatus]|uniref:Secreted protein n=1 Tax=Actinoplanes lobatus TaxID=113568 RepID=A0A7W7HGB8_9ACTN|nr:hypothetical protein [Actinoplanes lobatus]MBB4750035.1 hypothetical protein [Actinoplanes lobatus]
MRLLRLAGIGGLRLAVAVAGAAEAEKKKEKKRPRGAPTARRPAPERRESRKQHLDDLPGQEHRRGPSGRQVVQERQQGAVVVFRGPGANDPGDAADQEHDPSGQAEEHRGLADPQHGPVPVAGHRAVGFAAHGGAGLFVRVAPSR